MSHAPQRGTMYTIRSPRGAYASTFWPPAACGQRGSILLITLLGVLVLFSSNLPDVDVTGVARFLPASEVAVAYDEALRVDYAAPAQAIVEADPFALPAPLVARGTNSTKNVTLAADVFLVDGCVKFVSVVTCDFQYLNFSYVEPEVRAVWDDSVCSDASPCEGVAPTGRSLGRRPLTRILHRDGWNWEPVTVGELCLPELARASRVDVRLWYGGSFKDYSLRRIAREQHASEFAMMVMYRGDVWTSPAWLDVWTALGVGHFYVYYNGHLADMRAEAPRVIDALQRDPRVTLHTWPYPMRSVIKDPTGKSKLPEVNKYGKILCYLHYAKMMAFNDAFHRYGSRHAYMGFFDFDEYLGLPQQYFDAAAAGGTSPLHELRAAHADPEIFMLQNRWTGVFPEVPLREPLTMGAILNRRIYGGWYTDWAARSKFFVRCGGIGDASQQPYMIGNHYICKLRDAAHIGKAGATLQFRGRCDQPVVGTPAITRLEPPDHYSLHLLNLKPHESLLDFDAHAMLRQMRVNNTELFHIHSILKISSDAVDAQSQ